MKFDNLVESILLEMPHVSFNSKGKILNINLEMEKFQNNYEGFIQHAKDLINKIGSPEAQEDFKKELESNKQFALFLEKLFRKSFDSFIFDLTN